VANPGMLCLAIGAATLVTACAAAPTARPHSQPGGFVARSVASNIRVGFPLQPCVATMLSRSPTFRETYSTIAGRHDVRVTIELVPDRTQRVRAVTDVRSFAGGQRVAAVRLYSTTDVIELIAHEMEHVREQLEGTNLLLLSVARASDVRRLGTRFETRRGVETGLRVANEVGGAASRTCQGSLRDASLIAYSF